MDFGSTLKAAREARGLTTSQLAAQTRILVQTIEGMERNDFKRIPAPIYGRGFVKLICECLDLDPVIMVPAFMSAYNGEPQIPDEPTSPGGFHFAKPQEQPCAPPVSRPAAAEQPPAQDAPEAVQDNNPVTVEGAAPSEQPGAAEVASVTQDEPAAAPVTPPKPIVDSSLKGLELFDPSAVAPEPPPPPPQAEQPGSDGGFSRFAPPQKDESGFSRFAAPTANDDFSRFATPMPDDDTPDISPMDRFRASFSSVSSGVLGQMRKVRPVLAQRIALLAAGLLLVLVLCVWGIVALFRATSLDNEGEKTESPQAEQSTQKPAVPETPAATQDGQEAAETPAPTKPSVPLKLPGFYID